MIYGKLDKEIKGIKSDLDKFKSSHEKFESFLDGILKDDFFRSHDQFLIVLEEIVKQKDFYLNEINNWDILFEDLHNSLSTKVKLNNRILFSFINRINSLSDNKTSPISVYVSVLNVLVLNFALGVFKDAVRSRELVIKDEQKRKEIGQTAEKIRLYGEEFKQTDDRILDSSFSLKSEVISTFKELGVSLNIVQKIKLSWK